MISKKYRLSQNEFRKVLSRRKPFFSYMFIANILPLRDSQGKIGILLSSKCARGSVNRNFWRRRFYDLSKDFIENTQYNIVFVPKKGISLDHKNTSQLAEFEKNIQFLYKKIRTEVQK